MPTIAVAAVLDLWSLGHSASDISRKLGLTGHDEVARIVHKARLIGDPRAAIHVTANHRPTGNLRRSKALLAKRPDMEVVALVHRKWPRSITHCFRGHEFDERNTGFEKVKDGGGWRRRCRACARDRAAARR